MSLANPRKVVTRAGFPRVSGDEPGGVGSLRAMGGFSPRERG